MLTLTEVRKGNIPETALDDPFARLEAVAETESKVHLVNDKGVLCGTEQRGNETPGGGSPLELVVDSSEGFIPLWGPDVTLRWRFQALALEQFKNPVAVRYDIEKLLGDALLLWGDWRPIKFKQDDDTWDFEIVVREQERCSVNGCVLASAFFPDGGRHELVIYPTMFTQSREEQIETMAHEIGHIFGLRHFFALVKEAAFPAHVFGEHDKFTIMNYGRDSEMSDNDRSDLRKLYELVWSRQLTHINGTEIRLMRPYHESGLSAATLVAAI